MLGHVQPDILTLSHASRSRLHLYSPQQSFYSLSTFINWHHCEPLNYCLLLPLLQSTERDFSKPLIGGDVQQVVKFKQTHTAYLEYYSMVKSHLSFHFGSKQL